MENESVENLIKRGVGSKILVTGSSGFLGSHIADALFDNGYEVIFDNKASQFKKEGQTEFIGDLLSYEDLDNASDGCDYIYHYAAQADIGMSTSNPVETVQSNIIGTQNLLEIMRKKDIRRIIFASTIYVYSELGSFYRVSKQSCEKLIEEYNNQFSIDYTVLRYGSLYGPRANEFNFIFDMLNQAINDKKIHRKGNGEEIREYIHVKDAAKISVLALNAKYKNSHVIISGNQPIKVKDMLTMVKRDFQNKIDIVYSDEVESYHYSITPIITDQSATKITGESYYDLGQGIMDLIYQINEDKKSQN